MPDKFQLPKFETDGAGEKPVARSQFGDLLETSKLSRLPSLPKRGAFATATCGNCSKRLDATDDFQNKIKACRDCLTTYATVGELIADYTTAKIRRNYGGK